MCPFCAGLKGLFLNAKKNISVRTRQLNFQTSENYRERNIFTRIYNFLDNPTPPPPQKKVPLQKKSHYAKTRPKKVHRPRT